MSNSTSFPILNPDTPLAFLPPSVAAQLEVSRYIRTASLGAFAWDILIHSGQDYQLLFKHKLSLPTLTYFISRITAFAYIISATILQIGAVGNCQTLEIALGVCFAVAVPSTSFLFFLRIRAVFADQKIVVGLFGVVWLAVLGGCITVPFAIEGKHIGPTNRCINAEVKPFSSAGIVASAVNDTLVLLAISWKFMVSAPVEDNLKSRITTFWAGRALPYLSRTLLRSGQQYYLITVSGNIVTMAMILSPSIPPVYRAMLTVTNLAIENSMACKVFRDIKLGVIKGQESPSSIQRTTGGAPAVVYRYRQNHFSTHASYVDAKLSTFDATPEESTGMGMGIMKTVETVTDSPPIPMSIVKLHDHTQEQASYGGRKPSEDYSV